MKKIALTVLLTALSTFTFAADAAPAGLNKLDHVFVIVMENHGYGQIINNPNAPFINAEAASANLATNYFAVAHPSLTNYLELVGASNFGVQSDNNPDWHNPSCLTNLATGVANTDNPPSPAICPIGGTGLDAATPAVDIVNETQGLPGENNIDGIRSYASGETTGQTIADQLVAVGKTYKSYQESIPVTGVDNIDYSDGIFTNLTDFSTINPQLTPPLSQSDVVKLYASKHNPFVYFANVQAGTNAKNNLTNTVGFDGANGLFADLRAGTAPTYSFIVPNQCNDQHGRGNSTAFCNYDPGSDGTQASLNPALIYMGDLAVQKIVTAIKSSTSFTKGHNAIVIVWDENDYSLSPNINQVAAIVDTNFGSHGKQDNKFYTHFSLVLTLENFLGLPCLNHACDKSVNTMTALFQ